MIKASPNNLKSGVWLRTSPGDRRYTPDVLFRCVEINWQGDYNPSNKIFCQVYYDYEEQDFVDEPYDWDIITEMGLSPQEASWDEVIGAYSVYKSVRDVIKDMFDNPMENF